MHRCEKFDSNQLIRRIGLLFPFNLTTTRMRMTMGIFSPPLSGSSKRSSSISTPPLSDHEQERDDEISRSSSSPLSSSSHKDEEEVAVAASASTPSASQEPFILFRDTPQKSPPPSQTEQTMDLLDIFSTPPIPASRTQTGQEGQRVKNLLEDSLSSEASFDNREESPSISEHHEPVALTPSASPMEKSSSPSTSSKGN